MTTNDESTQDKAEEAVLERAATLAPGATPTQLLELAQAVSAIRATRAMR